MGYLFETAYIKNEPSVFLKFPTELAEVGSEHKFLVWMKSYITKYGKLPELVTLNLTFPWFSLDIPYHEDVAYIFDDTIDTRAKTKTEAILSDWKNGVISADELRAKMGMLYQFSQIKFKDEVTMQDWCEWDIDLSGIPGNVFHWHINKLDEATEGIHDGDFVVIAGRPGDGKTTLMIRECLNWWQGGKDILFISREMTSESIYGKFSAMLAGFNALKLRAAWKLDSNTKMKLEIARHMIRSVPNRIIIPPMNINSPGSIYSYIVRSQIKFSAVAIDGLYLMKSDGKLSSTQNWERVAAISHDIRNMALELNIPFITTTQLNRNGNDKDPDTADIAYSDSVIQDAVFALAVRRQKTDKKKNDYFLIKNRFGPADVRQSYEFDAETSTFYFQ